MIKTFTSHKQLSVFLLLLTLLSACGGSNDANNNQATIVLPPVQTTLSATIDAYLADNLTDTEPGLSVLVRKDNIAIYNRSKGLARKTPQSPLNNNTGYRLASVSKLFTAIAVMQLHQQQQLQLNDAIRQHLPQLPVNWQNITIHQLLTHQSGIPDYANDFSGSAQEWLRGMTNEQLLAHYASHDTLEFQPGSQTDYSNSGYVLLAEIISQVSGMSFADYMQANIFTPANMSGSYIINQLQPLKTDGALNYAQSAIPFDFEHYLTGAAAQVSTLEDMNNFIAALLDNQLITQDSFNLMLEAHSVIPMVGGTYGYAWRHGTGNVESFDINGSYDSFQSLIILIPIIDLEVVILSNGGEATNTHKGNIMTLINEFYNQQG